MMAMFFAQRVILGKTAYADVPAVLKPAVAELLNDAGLGLSLIHIYGPFLL